MKAFIVALMLSSGISLYPNAGVVTEVNREADLVTFCDGYHDWTFEGCEDWDVGDGIAVIMSDNGTETVYDDEVISVKYVRN